MSSVTRVAETLDDLYRVKGKAELINGRIVHQMPTGFLPGRVGYRICRSLDDHAETTGHGVALPDNVGFAVPELSSGRQSFSPDIAYYLGSLPSNPMRFVEGPPTFAVEVRSENDYGDAAEAEMAANVPTTSRQGPPLSGTSIPSMSLSGCIARIPPTSP